MQQNEGNKGFVKFVREADSSRLLKEFLKGIPKPSGFSGQNSSK